MVASLSDFSAHGMGSERAERTDSNTSLSSDRASDAPRSSRDPYRHLLVLRFALLNLMGFTLLAAAHMHGLVEMVITGDKTYISVVIFVVFLIGLALCANKIWITSRDTAALRRFLAVPESPPVPFLATLLEAEPKKRNNLAGSLRMEFAHRISVVRHVASNLVLLGLVGTVVGFIIALSGVDPAEASDINAIAPMVSTLIEGMSTALYTTLVGAVLNIWLMANHQVLAGGTVKLIAATVEAAECRA